MRESSMSIKNPLKWIVEDCRAITVGFYASKYLDKNFPSIVTTYAVGIPENFEN